jgi:hypothetical protein
MPIVLPADDVTLVGGSIIVNAHLPINVHTTIDVNTSVYMRASVVAAVVTPTVMVSVPPSMAPAVPFRFRCRHDPKPERRSDRENERKPLQHFLFFPFETMSAYFRNRFMNAH